MSNWQTALEARDLEFLRLLIQIIDEHKEQTGKRIKPHELKLAIERGWP